MLHSLVTALAPLHPGVQVVAIVALFCLAAIGIVAAFVGFVLMLRSM